MPNEPPDKPKDVKLGRPKNTAATNFKLETAFSAEPGSLPRLRFNYRYRLRARICDLAGNSVFGPDDPLFAGDVPEQTPEFPCARYEPVAPPPMMLRNDVVEGESLEHLVVRTPPLAGSDATERHVVPPKISQLMAEQHGKFDGVKMDSSPAGYALAGREAGELKEQAPEAQFTITYLPDPSSRGAGLFGLPGDTADNVRKVTFAGDWPDPLPFRLRLVGISKDATPAHTRGLADRFEPVGWRLERRQRLGDRIRGRQPGLDDQSRCGQRVRDVVRQAPTHRRDLGDPATGPDQPAVLGAVVGAARGRTSRGGPARRRVCAITIGSSANPIATSPGRWRSQMRALAAS